MAKTEGYKWPSGIDASISDHEIALGTKSTAGKMVPLKQIAAVTGWTFLNGYLLQSLIFPANVFIGILYLIWAILAAVVLFRVTSTRELAVRQVIAYITYAPKTSRVVMTRLSSKPAGFYNLVGIKEVHDDGLIEYADNTYGRALLVVGTASMMLFDNDRDSVTNAVDLFWRKMPTDVEMIQVTTKEPQRVAYQVDALQQRMKHLSVDSEDLKGLLEEQFNRMRDVSTRFLSIHQYIIIKGEYKESIDTVVSLMLGEVEYSGRVFQSYTMLDSFDSVIRMLKPLYEGRQGFDAMNAKLKRKKAKFSPDATTVFDSSDTTGSKVLSRSARVKRVQKNVPTGASKAS